MSKKEFWIRFAVYVLFGGLLPAMFLIFRFKLFSKINSITVGGWGLVCIIFLCGFFISMAKAVKKGLPYSFWTQVLNGVSKVIVPLLGAILAIYCLQDSIKQLLEFLIVVFVCEVIAIPVNPFPKWIHINKLNENEESLYSVLKRIKDNKEE